jgi:hypothetical protein
MSNVQHETMSDETKQIILTIVVVGLIIAVAVFNMQRQPGPGIRPVDETNVGTVSRTPSPPPPDSESECEAQGGRWLSPGVGHGGCVGYGSVK